MISGHIFGCHKWHRDTTDIENRDWGSAEYLTVHSFPHNKQLPSPKCLIVPRLRDPELIYNLHPLLGRDVIVRVGSLC